MTHWWNSTDRWKQNLSDNYSLYYFDHNKSHADWLWIEPVSLSERSENRGTLLMAGFQVLFFLEKLTLKNSILLHTHTCCYLLRLLNCSWMKCYNRLAGRSQFDSLLVKRLVSLSLNPGGLWRTFPRFPWCQNLSLSLCLWTRVKLNSTLAFALTFRNLASYI